MSPESVAAKSTSPGPPCATKVFRKNDSPENIRLRPLIRPPACVCICTFVLMPTIAPDSARIASPASSPTRAIA